MHKKTYKYSIIIGVLAGLLVFTTALLVGRTIKSNETRGQLDSVRKQLSAARTTNRELTEQLESANSRLEQINQLCKELGDTTGRNITTIRECIELLEEERYIVACISYYSSCGNSDELYDRIDNWLESQGVDFAH